MGDVVKSMRERHQDLHVLHNQTPLGSQRCPSIQIAINGLSRHVPK